MAPTGCLGKARNSRPLILRSTARSISTRTRRLISSSAASPPVILSLGLAVAADGRRGAALVSVQGLAELLDRILDGCQPIVDRSHVGLARQMHRLQEFLHLPIEVLARGRRELRGLIHYAAVLLRTRDALADFVDLLFPIGDEFLPGRDGIERHIGHVLLLSREKCDRALGAAVV